MIKIKGLEQENLISAFLSDLPSIMTVAVYQIGAFPKFILSRYLFIFV